MLVVMLQKQTLCTLIFFLVSSFFIFLKAEGKAVGVATENTVTPHWDALKWEEIEGNEVNVFVISDSSAKQKRQKVFQNLDEAFSYIAIAKKTGKKN